jgi:hypothetical protein
MPQPLTKGLNELPILEQIMKDQMVFLAYSSCQQQNLLREMNTWKYYVSMYSFESETRPVNSDCSDGLSATR